MHFLCGFEAILHKVAFIVARQEKISLDAAGNPHSELGRAATKAG